MVKEFMSSRLLLNCVFFVAFAAFFTGCDPQSAEMAALKAENDRLRAELANLRGKPIGTISESTGGKPDLILEFNELWNQRFEDNEFRARQRLADKVLRVTGILDGISRENLLLYGLGRSKNVRISVNLEKAYASKIQDGLAALERGVTLTVQGRFAYDRMELNDSMIVDKATGAPQGTEEIQSIGQTAPVKPVPVNPSAGNQ